MPLFQRLRNWRKNTISASILKAFKKVLPPMSSTEKEAIEAGTVWWEAELFSGRPDWQKLMNYPVPTLTVQEQAFLDNEVEQACALVNDWEVTTQDMDLPEAAWQYLKDNKFLGMIIPQEYGGLGFSAFAHSEVITKLSTRNSALAVSVMVPNSLGPAELLIHYGTPEQKNHYLPRLATGQEIPAFALTSPWAGSDAAAIPDSGVVCKGLWEGKEVLGMRVSWDKRYITLAPVCTLLGLAFKLYDPDGLLGEQKEIGITCALVPRDHPGVEIGRRHFPLNAMFMNGPTRGKDVFMPLDFIIGGPAMAGQGWRMLMECLAAGRAISLPSSNVGMSQLAVRTVGAYARIRIQFNLPIGHFEGVEEVLARMGANTYAGNAVRIMTAGAVDLGEKPSVVSSIAKYHVTERARSVINDAMDIIGGKGICLGPSNFLGRAYQQIPIGITVEGANILTRNLIIFGQGAIRCHPYLLKEMQAAQEPDSATSLDNFDRLFWQHVGFSVRNGLRTLASGLFGARIFTLRHQAAAETKSYYQHLTRLSGALAFMADVTMLAMGGSLKRREKISARLGDVLAQLYIASCVLKQYESHGRQQDELPFVHKAVQQCLFEAQTALLQTCRNFPNRNIGLLLRLVSFPWGASFSVPADALDHPICEQLMQPGSTRDRLTANCYCPTHPEDPVSAIELALVYAIKAEPVEAKIRQDEKNGLFKNHPEANVRDIARLAFDMNRISAEEYELLATRNRLRDTVIHVDDFPGELRNPAAFMNLGNTRQGDPK